MWRRLCLEEGGRAHRCAQGNKAMHAQDPLPGPGCFCICSGCWRDQPRAELTPKGRSGCGDGWRQLRGATSGEKRLSVGTRTNGNYTRRVCRVCRSPVICSGSLSLWTFINRNKQMQQELWTLQSGTRLEGRCFLSWRAQAGHRRHFLARG